MWNALVLGFISDGSLHVTVTLPRARDGKYCSIVPSVGLCVMFYFIELSEWAHEINTRIVLMEIMHKNILYMRMNRLEQNFDGPV